MFASARKAFAMLLDPAAIGVVLKSLALTVLLFVVLFLGLQLGLAHLPVLGAHWVNVAVTLLADVAAFAAFFVLGAPVTALFGSLFLDSIAARVERLYYPADAPPHPVPLATNLVTGLGLTGWVIVVTVALLPFDVALPGIGSLATIAADGWLLGREFFELVALRHMSRGEATALRRRHSGTITGAGILIALLSAIPLINLFVPLFATAFMVHVFKRLTHQERLP